MLEKQEKRKRRHKRVRSEISGTLRKPRLSVFRSSKHIEAQLIDDDKGQTLVLASDKEISSKKKAKKGLKGKTAKAFLVGELLAQKAGEAGIKEAVFDRGGYQYHGRIKALREGAREGGLKV